MRMWAVSKVEAAKLSKYAEGKVSDRLKEIVLNSCSNSYRYPDARSTRGGFSNKQPADFFAIINGRFMNLEVKSSVIEVNFAKCFKGLIKDHQMTSARKTVRAGGHYFFIFLPEFTEYFEVWDSRDLMEPYSTPRMPLKAEPVALISVHKDYNVWHSELLRVTLQ